MRNDRANSQERARTLAHQSIAGSEFVKLPATERARLMEESAAGALEVLRASDAVEYRDVSEMYRTLRGEQLFVRREDPARVMNLVANNEPIEIGFPDGERYSNAVEWNPSLEERGLKNAYDEGYGQMNGIVTVIGFRASDQIDSVSLPDAAQRFAGLDRAYVRSIKGEVEPEDVVFIALRIPASAFPESEMRDAEAENYEIARENGKPSFVHRGFLFLKNLQKQ